MINFINKDKMLADMRKELDNFEINDMDSLAASMIGEHFYKYIQKFPTVNPWISCKDKMPEDNTLVLFVYVSGNGVKSVHYGYHQTLKGLGSSWAKPSGGWEYCDDDVSHWQPLPEPPKEELNEHSDEI